MMKRIPSLLCVLLAAIPLLGAKKPNIICILVDDLGYSDLSSFGGKDIRTGHRQADGSGHALRPVLRQLHGLHAHPGLPHDGPLPGPCGGPRGRSLNKRAWGFFRPTGPTLPELMSKAGYHTGMVGKWHLGYSSPNLPNDHGFDFFHGFLGDMMDDYWTHLRGGVNWMRKNKEVIKPKGHATEIFSQWAIDYMKEQSADKKKPFFLYLAYNAPLPHSAPKDWLEKVEA